MNMYEWLKKPYPLLEKKNQKLLLSASFGLFASTFLIIFQPFDANKISENRTLFLAGFGLCVSLGLFITYSIIPLLLARAFNPEKWNIKKEILYLTLSFVVIALLNYTYNTFIGKNIAVYKSFWEFFGITVAVGAFPVIILIFLIERSLYKTNSEKAEVLSKSFLKQNGTGVNNTQIKIRSENKKANSLIINTEDFIFAKSDNNYTTIFYDYENEIKRKLLRLSIKNLEQQLSEHKNITRCHRSYLINQQKIESIKGNARSLVLHIKNCEEVVPVSRSFPKERLL